VLPERQQHSISNLCADCTSVGLENCITAFSVYRTERKKKRRKKKRLVSLFSEMYTCSSEFLFSHATYIRIYIHFKNKEAVL
jgi:hypothetical protein